MPPSHSRGRSDDVGERLGRAELSLDHNAEGLRDVWKTITALRDSYQGFAGKTDVFLARAEEVLKRVDDHGVQIRAMREELAETKGRRTVFHTVVAFGSSIVGGLFVHFFPGGNIGGH